MRDLFGPGDLAAFLLFGGALLIAVAAGEALRAGAGWRPEASRRFVHAAVGVLVALCPPLFTRPGPVYVLAAGFVAVNVVAVRRRLLPGMHAVERATWGTVVFPLALIAALALTWSVDEGRVFALRAAFLVLALADPLASIAGGALARPGRYVVGRHEKSVAGSAAFFAAAAVLSALGLAAWGPPLTPGQVAGGALVAAGLATAAEALGTRGWDNLGIVLAVVVPLVVLGERPGAAGPMAAALAGAVAFGVLAWRVRALDLSGALAAGLLAWGVLALGGAAWAVPGLTFFVLSSLLSMAGRRRKRAAARLAEKDGHRDAAQVVANGGVAAALLAAHALLPAGADPGLGAALYWGFVGAFAAAAADTWGTEVGTLVGGPTWDVLRRRRVEPGASGGVSAAGTAAALAGAAAVFVAAWPFAGAVAGAGPDVGTAALLVVGGGFAAALLDSVLGATAQARYRAPDGALTERRTADGTPSGAPLPLVRGWGWVDNDRVNLLCTLAGGLLPLLLLG
jgi:uncharacterized protein (TIGR00297 family)